MLLEVLEVQQFEGDAGLPPLGLQVRTVGDGPKWIGGVGGLYTHVSRASSPRASTWAQSSPATRARSTVGADGPGADPRSAPPPGGSARGPTSVTGSLGSCAWTVAQVANGPFLGSVRLPAPLGSDYPPRRGCRTGSRRGYYDGPIHVITPPIPGIFMGRSG